MSDLKYGVNDSVRIVFESYFDLAKCNFSQMYNLGKTGERSDLLNLGGCYVIDNISENEWGVNIFSLKRDINSIHIVGKETGNHICHVEDAPVCKFIKNDTVVFEPNMINDKDLDLLFLKDILKNKEHLVVARIIFDFYVFVKRYDGKLLEFPIKWTDLKSVNKSSG